MGQRPGPGPGPQPAESEVRAFLTGGAVLVTGGSGFLGALLLEKLLRACPAVGAVYLLLRPKRGEPPQRRLQRLLDDPLFNRVRGLSAKVVLVEGDCAAPGLGLSEASRALLQREVSVVFHCAATVRFNEPLRSAALINVSGTRELLRLARDMPRLQALVHVSTAFAFYPEREVLERPYEPPLSADQLLGLLETLDDGALDLLTPRLLKSWPNTYTFSKAISESVIQNEHADLPVCILRPSIVINTAREPEPGWVRGFGGSIGVAYAIILGLLHVSTILQSAISDMVPADIVVNGAIAAAWDTAARRFETRKYIPIYNIVSSPHKKVTWGKCRDVITEAAKMWPSIKCVWYPYMIQPPNPIVSDILCFVICWTHAAVLDIGLMCTGHKPVFWKHYQKLHAGIDAVKPFTRREWIFKDGNTQSLWKRMNSVDKDIFPFNMDEVDMIDAIKEMVRGIRFHALKEPLENLHLAKIKLKRLKILHYIFVSLVTFLPLFLIYWKIK